MLRSFRSARPLLAAAFLLTAAAPRATTQESPAPGTTGRRPNILFVFSDDHAPHAIGAYGGRLAQIDPTPRIDALAEQGMLFRQSFCTNSICGPSRAVVLTGKHSHVNGFRRNGNRFDGDQQTFPKLLQKAGYTTAMIGKWHLSSDPQGFDHWEVLPGQGAYYNPRLLHEGGERVVQGYCTDIVTDLAIEWLEQQQGSDEPWLLMCQHKAPHRNWMPAPRHLDLYDDIDIPEPGTLFDRFLDNAPPARAQEMTVEDELNLVYDLFLRPEDYRAAYGEDWDPKAGKSKDSSGFRNLQRMSKEQLATWWAAYDAENRAFAANPPTGRDLVRWKYQRYMKNYLRSIRGVDDSVGRLVDFLDATGLGENTVVIYCSDQGFYLGDHGWYDKRWMYEESLRMPLIVRWPAAVQPGSTCDALVQNLDYAATFLDLAGAAIPNDIQGRSLAPFLRGQQPKWRDAIYYHYYEFPSVHMVARHYGIRTDRHKLIHFYQTGHWELYDLERDPDELHNLHGDPAYADLASRLALQLGELRAFYGDDSPPAGGR